MSQELAVLPAKTTDVLVITPDIESDLYNEVSQKTIEAKIELLGSLAFSDDQEAEMDETATAMNKFATALDKLSAATYKKVTESASKNRDITKAQVTVIKNHRTRIISQFEAQKKAKLDAIRDILADALATAWEEKGVSLDFRKADLPEPKKSMLTDKGALTLSTKRTIDQLAQDDKNWQLELEGRIKDVKLACHEAGIVTPFTESYIGGVFYGQDRAAFEKRLELLVQEELKRRERDKEKMRLELEAENQRKIDEALRHQEAENKRQRDLEEAERKRQEEKPTTVVTPVEQKETTVIPASEYGLRPVEQVTSNVSKEESFTGEVCITLSFVLPLKAPATKTFLKGWFLNSFPEKVRNALTNFEVKNV